VRKKLAEKKAIFLDVREQAEWDDGCGRLPRRRALPDDPRQALLARFRRFGVVLVDGGAAGVPAALAEVQARANEQAERAGDRRRNGPLEERP